METHDEYPDETLIPMWRAFIIAKHPAAAGRIPDDSCYPKNSRRAKVNTFGDVKNLTVNWTPTTRAPPTTRKMTGATSP